jgi:hypothetical protein
MSRGSQLFNDNPRGKPRLRTLGYGTRKKAKNSIRQLQKMPTNYQRQAATTMYYRAKYHRYRTADMEEAMTEYGKFLQSLRKIGGQQPEFTITYQGIGQVSGEDWTRHCNSLQSAPVPTITISRPGKYLLVMTDPNTINGCFTHWIAQIEGSDKIKHVVSYHPPTPPPGTGQHRYIFTLYPLDNNKRACFSKYFTINA